MTKTLTFEHLLWLDTPECIPTGLAHGLIDAETMEATKTAYDAFIATLRNDWTPSRILAHLTDEQRKNYKSTAYFIQKLELDNRDARVRGVSYKERQSFTAKIKTGYKLLQDIQRSIPTLKSKNITVDGLVRPSDMGFIQQYGFGEYLRQNVLGSYPLAVAVLPVKV